MPATLSEAFGENFDIVPSLNSQRGSKRSRKHKKDKKNKYHQLNQEPTFGQEIPYNNFTAPEEPRYFQAEVQPSLGDQQFQALTDGNEFGPTNYSIKPAGSNDYYDANMLDDEEDLDEIPPKPEAFSDDDQKALDNYDPRMAEFSKKLDLILEKLGHLDEPAQENIHDIILFVIFGVFVIFIMDSVYRVGKVSF